MKQSQSSKTSSSNGLRTSQTTLTQPQKDSSFSATEQQESFFQPKPISQTPIHLQRKCDHCHAEDKEKQQEVPKVQTMPAFESDALPEESAVQPKLTIGQPNDKYEQEADAMAERVVENKNLNQPFQPSNKTGLDGQGMINAEFKLPKIPKVEEKPPTKGAAEAAEKEESAEQKEEATKNNPVPEKKEKAKIQLPKLEKREKDQKEIPEIQTKVQPDKTNEKNDAPQVIQKKQNANGEASSSLHGSLQKSKGRGENLNPEVQQNMEGHFGRDLSQVRIHQDGAAIQMNQSLGAKAFTNQNDIYFNSGEYNPNNKEGEKLLAHELTHTIQQNGDGKTIQKFSPPGQDASIEGKPSAPNDGPAVTGKVNSRIEGDSRNDEKDDLSEEEKQEAKNPNRGEIRQEKGEVQGSGVSTPPDRGSEAGAKIAEEKAQMNEKLSEDSPNTDKEGGEGGKGEEATTSDADAFAQKAAKAEQQAQGIKIPDKPEPFKHPTIEGPEDSVGEKLPMNGIIDTQVRGLGMIGEVLRKYGYESKRHAAEQEIHSLGVESVTEKLREDLSNAKEGTNTIEKHNEERKEISTESKSAHKESVERQQFVAQKAPDLAAKASEGSGEAGELASEAKGKSEQAQSEKPTDQDAAADAEKQSGEMNETAEGALSMDTAIQQSEQRGNQLAADAETAAGDNSSAEGKISETDETIALLDGRIGEMHAKNAETQGKIDNAAPGPNLMRKFSKEEAQTGDDLIAVSILMEQELISIQEQYLADMAAIESLEEAKKKLLEEQRKTQTLSPAMLLILELAGIPDEVGIVARLEKEPPERKEEVKQELDKMESQIPEEGEASKEKGKEKEEGKGGGDPREGKIQAVENQRIQRLQLPLDMADQNMGVIPAHDQQRIANALVVANFTDQVKNIDPLQMGKEAIKGMVNPLAALDGVTGGFKKLGSGLSAIGDLQAWADDPLGQLLKVAANVSTGLAMIFSSILGVAGTITALMAAITVISWFTLSPVTAPVIGWMGTIMTYAGWGAIITGSLSVYFNYLSYMKNLHEAGTAPTARELFANTEEMKENAADGLTGAMAVVEGVGAVKMGPALKSGKFMSGLPKSPGQFAKQTMAGAKGGIKAIAGAPGAIAKGAKNLFKGGKKGIRNLKGKFQKALAKTKGKPGSKGVDIDTPSSKKVKKQHLDSTKNKTNSEMSQQDIKAEVDNASSARKIDNDPEVDVEVKTNDHTYKKRKDGEGWCRHTNEGAACKIDIGEGNNKKLNDKAGDVDKPTKRQREFEDDVRKKREAGEIDDKMMEDMLEYNKRNPSGKRTPDDVKTNFEGVNKGNRELTPDGRFKDAGGKKNTRRFDDNTKKQLEADVKKKGKSKAEDLTDKQKGELKKKADDVRRDIAEKKEKGKKLKEEVDTKSDKDLSDEAKDYKKNRDDSFKERHPEAEIRKRANEKFERELGELKDSPGMDAKRQKFFDAELAETRRKHNDNFERGKQSNRQGEALELSRETDGFTRKTIDEKTGKLKGHREKVTIDGKDYGIQIDLKKPPNELLEMKSGKISLDAKIEDQMVRHAALVKNGQKMTWELLEGASGDVITQLERFGIDYIDYSNL